MKFLITMMLFVISQTTLAQKEVYLPNDFTNPNEPEGMEFTWDKTRESENFILIWGNEATTDPLNAPDPNLRFDPEGILDTLEYIYDEFVDFGFAQDLPGTNLYQYKIVVVMLLSLIHI